VLLLEREIDRFFVDHQSQLLPLHPGLNAHTLKRELLWLYDLEGFNFDKKKIFDRLLAGEPLAYIVGFQYFFDAFFKVNSSTLIPRPETEIMVAHLLERFGKKSGLHFADIGTGSGALGLSIAMHLEKCHAHLSDICPKALSVAKENHFRLARHFDHNQEILFHLADRLNFDVGLFDFIVTNPPYIKEVADRAQVHQQVLKNEPALALFLPDGEYSQWFTTLFTQVADKLKPGGYFLMEGHEAHLDELVTLMGSLGRFKDIRVIPDLAGRSRFIEGIKNG
tara:strand:+ start:12652 stop:13491 length:840 start_codon:yes stop_codon:yes gene_type:complete